MWRTLQCDLKKTICSPGFGIAVAATVLLCFTSTVYGDDNNGKMYSVMEALLSLDKSVITSNYEFSSIRVFRNALGGYFGLFLPVVTALPHMLSFCAERNSGCIRFSITRTGKRNFYLSKFFSAVLVGGLCVLCGVLLYGLLVSVLFPSLSSYQLDAQMLEVIMPNGVFQTAIRICAAAFVYGVVMTLPAILLSSFCRDPYLISCVPFLLFYIWDTVIKKLNTDYGMQNLGAYSADSLPSLIGYGMDAQTARLTVLINILYFVVILLAYFGIVGRRFDQGA
jgi:hypothetical protein